MAAGGMVKVYTGAVNGFPIKLGMTALFRAVKSPYLTACVSVRCGDLTPQ